MEPFDKDFLDQIGQILQEYPNLKDLNEFMIKQTGLSSFAKSIEDLEYYKKIMDKLEIQGNKIKDFGEYQTPILLTDQICKFLKEQNYHPDIIFEPTCGEGSFILSSIKNFPALKQISCLDVQRKNGLFLRLNLLRLSFEMNFNVNIEFYSDSIFNHKLSNKFEDEINGNKKILILGNPPWVTNTDLSSMNSVNLPIKTNVKTLKGIEAITGRANFDITEAILIHLSNLFSNKKCKICMLCKKSVIKNIVRDGSKLNLNISNIHSLDIDAKKEFNINASAALLVADLGSGNGTTCKVSSFYTRENLYEFGWASKQCFVSNIELYKKFEYIDGGHQIESPKYEWRQGVKHDAIKIMVLKKEADGNVINGLNKRIEVEDELLYPFLRGSTLNKSLVQKNFSPNLVILTQKSLNEDTSIISSHYPKLWEYLLAHSDILDHRKSQIYNDRPRFSIFGIGAYAFKPFKIGISGFHKNSKFSLIFSIDSKPVMLDDTCYYLSFDNLNEAFFIWILLNSEEVKHFLNSISFLDSKRPFTKGTLMRINIQKLITQTSFESLMKIYNENLQEIYEYNFNINDFNNVKKRMNE